MRPELAVIAIVAIGVGVSGFVLQPGVGWVSDKDAIADHVCFKEREVKRSAGRGSVDISTTREMQSEEIYNSFGISVSGTFKKLVDFGGQTSKDSSQSSKGYSYTTYFTTKFTRVVSVFYSGEGEAILSDDGLRYYKQGPEIFRARCGNALIQQYEEGAVFTAQMKMTFKSFSQQRKWAAEASAGLPWGIAEIKGRMSNEKTRSQYSGSITLSFSQVGGKPHKLGEALSQNTPCSFENFESCANQLSQADRYVRTFGDQLDDDNLWEPIRIVKRIPAREYSLNIAGTALSPEIIKARQTILKLLRQFWPVSQVIERIPKYPVKLSANLAQVLESQAEEARANRRLVEEHGKKCWEVISECLAATKTLQDNWRPLTIPSGLITTLQQDVWEIRRNGQTVLKLWPIEIGRFARDPNVNGLFTDRLNITLRASFSCRGRVRMASSEHGCQEETGDEFDAAIDPTSSSWIRDSEGNQHQSGVLQVRTRCHDHFDSKVAIYRVPNEFALERQSTGPQ